MATMDSIKLAGGEPANFLDIATANDVDKVVDALLIISRDPNVKAILVNIFGGMARVDIIAQGIINAQKKMAKTMPVVARLAGTNVEEGERLIKESGLPVIRAEELGEAAKKAVAAAKAASARAMPARTPLGAHDHRHGDRPPHDNAATALLAALDDAQRAKASFALDDEAERRSWAYFPRNFPDCRCARWTAAQRKLAHALVASGLSVHAYAQATTIIALDDVLNEIEGRVVDAVRDPAATSSASSARRAISPVGLAVRRAPRLVALHDRRRANSFRPRRSSSARTRPRSTPRAIEPIIRPCGEEEDVARDLLASLDAGPEAHRDHQRVAPPDIVLMNLPRSRMCASSSWSPASRPPCPFGHASLEGMTPATPGRRPI